MAQGGVAGGTRADHEALLKVGRPLFGLVSFRPDENEIPPHLFF
ncbi:hypothetical protein AWT69_000742 [Pseudomonas putida]|nr:hypothetical protein AWT69_000742 [Pseudomonas putida]